MFFIFSEFVDDATQEVFVECFKQGGVLDQADPTRLKSFHAFLLGVVRNVCRRYETRKVKVQEVQSDSCFSLEDEVVEVAGSVSPVPGGVSMINQSKAGHFTSSSNCLDAPITIGPRQANAFSSLTKNPIDISDRPAAESGMTMPS